MKGKYEMNCSICKKDILNKIIIALSKSSISDNKELDDLWKTIHEIEDKLNEAWGEKLKDNQEDLDPEIVDLVNNEFQNLL